MEDLSHCDESNFPLELYCFVLFYSMQYYDKENNFKTEFLWLSG